jgi:hypothetical protein
MFPPKFDIFSGVPARNAMWIGVADTVNAAQRRMKELATKKPGPYFVYSAEAKKAIAWLDTTLHYHAK